MLKAYEFRIFPTKEQEQFLYKTAGLTRLYWNLSLSRKDEAFKKGEKIRLLTAKQLFLELKPEAIEWMKEVDSTPFAAKYMDITSAFNNFFNSCKGKRKLRTGKPRYESKKRTQVAVTWSSAQPPKILKNGYLFITRKLGPVKGTFHRWAEGEFRHATIKQTTTGKWFVKICVDKKPEAKNKNGKSVGIDWNCRDNAFVTMSNGTKIKCPRYLRQMQKQLVHQQRKLERQLYQPFFEKFGKMPDLKNSIKDRTEFKLLCEIMSNSYIKQRRKVAKLHEKVAWQRKDWLHKLSRQICNEYETVYVEDINLQTMASALKHGKVVGDQGFGMLRQMIAYKGSLVKVNPKNTSKTCHVCGYVNPKVVVGVDEWDCPNCGSHHDRDVNAALNILHKGNALAQSIVGGEPAEITNACGGPKSSMKQEVSQPSKVS